MSAVPFRKSPLFRFIALTVLAAFAGMLPAQPSYAQVAIVMPPPGQMVHVTRHFEPPQMIGLKVNLKDPFSFDFIMDQGANPISDEAKKEEFNKIIKYFLVSLAMPNKEMWVNLSPYESNRIIPEIFAQTVMGRDLLAQDYILKQFTASLMYPESGLGKTFWNKVYAQAQARFGTTDINVNTFNKVWIVADKADIYQKDDTAFLVDSHLKVMLEQDYKAIEKNKEMFGQEQSVITDETSDTKTTMASEIVRQIIIPAIEKEVNEGKNFAAVRQVYNAEIMATWFKKTLRQSLLGQVFADKSQIAGQKNNDPQAMEKIYKQYLRAYKKGVFNYIKEDATPDGQTIPRKYFSGGLVPLEPAMVSVFSNKAMTLDQRSMVRRFFDHMKNIFLPNYRLALATVAFTTLTGGIFLGASNSANAQEPSTKLPSTKLEIGSAWTKYLNVNDDANKKLAAAAKATKTIDENLGTILDSPQAPPIEKVEGSIAQMQQAAVSTAKNLDAANGDLEMQGANMADVQAATLQAYKDSQNEANIKSNNAFISQEESQWEKDQKVLNGQLSKEFQIAKKVNDDRISRIRAAKKAELEFQIQLNKAAAQSKKDADDAIRRANIGLAAAARKRKALDDLAKKEAEERAKEEQEKKNNSTDTAGNKKQKGKEDKKAPPLPSPDNESPLPVLGGIGLTVALGTVLTLGLRNSRFSNRRVIKPIEVAQVKGPKIFDLFDELVYKSRNISDLLNSIRTYLSKLGSASPEDVHGIIDTLRNLINQFSDENHMVALVRKLNEFKEELSIVEVNNDNNGQAHAFDSDHDESKLGFEEMEDLSKMPQAVQGNIDVYRQKFEKLKSVFEVEVERILSQEQEATNAAKLEAENTAQNNLTPEQQRVALENKIKSIREGAKRDEIRSEITEKLKDMLSRERPKSEIIDEVAKIVYRYTRIQATTDRGAKNREDIENYINKSDLNEESIPILAEECTNLVHYLNIVSTPKDVQKEQINPLLREKKALDASPAMAPGGISLTDEHLAIHIRVDGDGMPLPAQDQDKAMMNLKGLSSIIRKITPVTPENLPALYAMIK